MSDNTKQYNPPITGDESNSDSDSSLQDGDVIKTTYNQIPVLIPPSYLTTTPSDAKPITYQIIDFTHTPLPEYKDRYTAILDNVLSPSECSTLVSLAESSVPNGNKKKKTWKPALVNYGNGYEIMDREYRNSGRIVWGCQEIMDRLWERISTIQAVRETLAEVEEKGRKGVIKKWKFVRFNERGRFLKYSGGQYFRPHRDGSYSEKKGDAIYRAHYTLHLYLNDSVAEAEPEQQTATDLVGGATSFLSDDEGCKYDVNPKAGRVLIFQHDGMYHSGDDVVQGTKYTMRTDIMYELQRASA
ncbi:hypothetical protein V8F33_009886 [Rhypophila sp. PSN 637]